MWEGLAWPGQQPRVLGQVLQQEQQPRVPGQVLQQEQRPLAQGQLVPQGLVLVQQVRVLLHCQLAVVRSAR
jgi:hypothetical protein